MRILLAITAICLFAACGSSVEDVPTDAAATSPAVSADPGAIVVCPRVGDGSTPRTPTPVPSCRPSTGEALQLAPDVFGQVTEAPPLPAGKTAATDYVVIYGEASATIGIPVKSSGSGNANLAWYTYDSGAWTRLSEAVNTSTATIAQATFDPLPANLIVLAEQ